MAWQHSIGSSVPPKTSRGILRSSLKTTKAVHSRQQHKPVVAETKDEELLVFGYGSKLFPPDEYSRKIYLGQHLIPWNGDERLQLMIDRYDARASLHDLSEFDGDSWNTHYEVSEEEARIEELCDQERYFAMYADIAKENDRQEEELKRLQSSISETSGGTNFKEVGFDYGAEQTTYQAPSQQNKPSTAKITPTEKQSAAEAENEEKPFIAPSALVIPPGMEIPPTEKMNAIIEKTASFVSSQGAQMEIVLKAKQAKNKQFMFLQFDHYLNPYYKHVVRRIKEGKYRPGMGAEEKKEQAEEDSDSSSDGEGGYLHPSLFATAKNTNREENNKKFEAIQKVDPNHPLAKLIEKGKKANALKQYTMMKSAVENFKPGNGSLEPPQLPPFSNIDSAAALSPVVPSKEETEKQALTLRETSRAIVPPPPDIQSMVDTVARQIAEEGDELESHMRKRGDPTLAFLMTSHELHPYYKFRKAFIREQLRAQRKLLAAQEEDGSAEKIPQDEESLPEPGKKKKPEKSAPISFSIKPKKEAGAKKNLVQALNPVHALGYDSGDNEDEEELSSRVALEEETKDESEKEHRDGETVENGAAMVDVQYREASVKTALSIPVSLHSHLLPSSFTVVSPSGTAASIADFRKKQAERRQKATLFLNLKNKDSSEETKDNQELASESSVASQDIFQMDVDETERTLNDPSDKNSETVSSETPENQSVTELDIPVQASVATSKVTAAPTLKDLVVAASSRSGTSSPVAKKKKRKKDAKDYQSGDSDTAARKSRSRHRSGENDVLPSSYRKVQAHSSSPSRRPSDDVDVPSAYKIENPQPTSYDNGGSHRARHRDGTPSEKNSPSSKRKRHRHDVDKETSKKRHRSQKSPSHKTKKKHNKHVRSKRKHKKSDKRSAKSKKKKQHERSAGECSSSDEDRSSADEKKAEKHREHKESSESSS